MGKPLRPFHESVEDFKAITVNESFMPPIRTLSGKYWGRNCSSHMPPVAMSSSLDRDIARTNHKNFFLKENDKEEGGKHGEKHKVRTGGCHVYGLCVHLHGGGLARLMLLFCITPCSGVTQSAPSTNQASPRSYSVLPSRYPAARTCFGFVVREGSCKQGDSSNEDMHQITPTFLQWKCASCLMLV